MVIVFNHVLVSSFLFYRHPERFLINTDGCSNEASEEPRSASSNLTEQDTKLNSIVTETTDFRTLHVKVRDAIQNFASKSVTSVVYLIDVSTGNLYADKDNIICFPKSGIIWECFRSKKYRFSQNIDPNDPACPVLTLHQSNSRWKPKSVLCCPVNDMGEVIAVIVVSSSVAEEIDDLSLQPIADQIIGCYRNLCKGDGSSTSSERRESSSFPLAKSDKEAIMKLCGELYDQDASILQLKVIKYLEEQTNAECAFLLLVVPETQELFCQVIGHKVLDQEVRFPGQTSNFAKALETKEHMSLDDIPLDKRKGLEEFLDTSLQSLLCVPVASKHSDNLIALACVINKQDLESFTKVDVETIKTCFQYTATVLTSTLAFQNERKLKIQTQAMLQVARNLFTHLGEFTQLHGQGLNDFPDIPVGQTSVDVRGMSVGDILLNDNDKGLHTFSKSTRKDNYLQFNNSDRTQSQETQPSYLAMNPNDSNDTCIQILPENSFQVHLQYHDVACDTNDDKFEMLARSVQTVFGNSNSCADVENIEPPLQGTVSPYNVSVTHNTMASPYPTAPSEDPNVPYSLVSEDDYNDANPSLPDDQSSTTLKSTTTLPKASRSATDNLETFGDVPELNSDSAIRPVCNDTCIQTLSEKLDRFQVHPQYRDVACDTNDYKLEMLARSVQTVFGNSISCADVENTEPPLHGTVSPYNVPVTHNTMASPYFTAPSEDPNVPYSLVSEDDYNYANLSLPDDQSNTTLKSTTTLPKASRSATDNVETYGDVPELNSDSAIRPVCNDTCIQTLSEKLDRFQVHPQYRDVACDTNDDKFEMLARSVQTVFGNSNSCADVENTEQPIHGTVSPYNVPVTQNTMASPSYHTALSEEPNVPYSFVSEDDYMDANLNLRDDQSETTLMSSTTLPKTSRSATDNVETYGDVPELKSDTTIRPVRWSSSDPSVSKTSVNTDLYIEESKPELNYAFLGGKTCNEDAIKNSRPVHMLPPTFLEEKRFTSASSPNEISQHSRESSIISLNSVTTYLTQLGWESMLQKIQHTSTNVIPITINDLTKLLREIMQEARNLTQAERCSVFLIDQETDELVAKVFDGITTNDNETKLVVSNQGLVHYPPSVQSEIRMPITQGIAGHVATTGNLLNIKDAYSHPMFYRGIDDSTGFRTRNILCFPIKNEIGVVLGVAQLCNKKTGPFFTTFDEDVASAFAVYCCISISHSLMYQRVIAAQIRNSLANELMMYHMKCLMYKKLQDSQHRNRLANELMIYHMQSIITALQEWDIVECMQQTLGSGSETALHTIYTHCRPISDYIVRTTHMLRESTGKDLMLDHLCNQTGAKYILIGCTEMAQVAQEDVDKLVHCNIPSVSDWHQNFDRFHFPPRQILEDDTSETCLTMFEDLGFIQKFRIRRDTLARFVLMVRRGYRNPPYHNWMHAFSVAHFCYVCVKNLDLQKHLDETELFALFVSCLCHDIDHRGTNNSYQVASKSVLAALYSSEGSVLERHHFAQTMCIVNTEGCNIFENLSSKDYQQVLDLVRDIILATDLAHHLRILKNIETMAKDGYQKSKLKNHKLLLCLLMTASDLSDQTKPWNYAKHIAALIYDEFFSQGDLEKSLGKEPMEMMDRERARIPDLQIGFLDHIALPVYKVLAQIFDAAKPVENAVEDNRRHWEKICGLIKLRRGGSCEQMSYDQILALEEEEEDKRSEISNHIQSQQNGKS